MWEIGVDKEENSNKRRQRRVGSIAADSDNLVNVARKQGSTSYPGLNGAPRVLAERNYFGHKMLMKPSHDCGY